MFVCRAARLPILGLLLGGLLAGCSGRGEPDQPGVAQVVVGFYAAQFLAETIGGDQASVTSLTRPGAEPHDLELTSRQLIGMAKSDLTITLTGFQPAVDQGIQASDPRRVLDLGPSVGVTLDSAASHSPTHESHEGHRHDEGAEDPAHDPHFWLDPSLMARAASAVATELAALDPAGAEGYHARLAALDSQLSSLSDALRQRVSNCAQRDLVTSHAAFGHLAAATGLVQHPLALGPESDPSASALAEITDLVRREGIRTIYTEPLASPRVAQVIARETGAQTAILDPIEGINEASAGTDYLAIMRANLDTLVKGQQCQG